MARICEVCGRQEDREEEQLVYDILDVCEDCTQHVVQQIEE
ncbi:hypothetical protein [Gracilibacillus salinarum]|nr:hypothetical protein [Gracilibacillus salinarum]